jgi:hypothetical protein
MLLPFGFNKSADSSCSQYYPIIIVHKICQQIIRRPVSNHVQDRLRSRVVVAVFSLIYLAFLGGLLNVLLARCDTRDNSKEKRVERSNTIHGKTRQDETGQLIQQDKARQGRTRQWQYIPRQGNRRHKNKRQEKTIPDMTR